MKFTVNKDDIKEASSAIKKIIGSKIEDINFVIDKHDNLNIIANGISYLKFIVPIDDVSKGKAALKFNLFESMSKLRSKKIKVEKNKRELVISGGSKLKLFCSQYEDIRKPDKSEDTINIKEKGTGIFKRLLEKVKFKGIVDIDNSASVISVENNSKKLILRMAESTHSVNYVSKNNISDKEFQFYTYLENLKGVMSFVNSKIKFYINKSDLLVSSDKIIATVPYLQSGFSDIESSIDFGNKEDLRSGKIVLKINDLKEVLKSLLIIKEGPNDLGVRVLENKMNFLFKTNLGTSKDNIECENSIGALDMNIPIEIWYNIIEYCSFSDNIEMRLSKEGNYYVIVGKNKELTCKCIGPLEIEE